MRGKIRERKACDLHWSWSPWLSEQIERMEHAIVRGRYVRSFRGVKVRHAHAPRPRRQRHRSFGRLPWFSRLWPHVQMLRVWLSVLACSKARRSMIRPAARAEPLTVSDQLQREHVA